MVTLILTLIFEIFAKPLSSLFALSGGTSKEIIEVCTISLRIASIGYIFMGFLLQYKVYYNHLDMQ